MGQSLCFLTCTSSDTQNTNVTLGTAKKKNINNGKPMFQEKSQQQQGPNKHRTSKHAQSLQGTERMSDLLVMTMRFKFVNQD